MPTATPQQVQVIYQEAFGRDATQEELDYYGSRGIDLLETNLRNDPNAGGKYASEPDVGNAPEPENFGEPLSFDNWLKSPEGSPYAEAYSPEMLDADFDKYYDKLKEGLQEEKDNAGGDLELAKERFAKRKGWATADLESVLKRERRTKKFAQEDFQRALSEGEEFKGIATENRDRILGRLEQDLGISKERTERATGEQAADTGLFGSGQYQEELGQQLGDLQRGYERQTGDIGREYEQQFGEDSVYSRQVAGLERDWARQYGDPDSDYRQRMQQYNRTYNQQWGENAGTETDLLRDQERLYERQWGTGEYTPYSLRKLEYGQQQKTAKYGAETGRKQEAWQQYQRQFQPGGSYYQNPAYQ